MDTFIWFLQVVSLMGIAAFLAALVEQIIYRHKTRVKPAHKLPVQSAWKGRDAETILLGARLWDVDDFTVTFVTVRFELVRFDERSNTLAILVNGSKPAVAEAFLSVDRNALRHIHRYQEDINALRGKYGYKI